MTEVQNRPFAAEVSRGADLVEKFFPGSLARVDLDRLTMWSTELCVLGQALSAEYTKYGWKLGALGLNFFTQYEYGFSISADAAQEWDALTDAWVDEIKNRT